MLDRLTLTPHAGGPGIIVQGQSLAQLDALNKDDILGQLKETGFILFRGFGAHIEAFSTLVQRLSTRVTLDPARAFNGQGKVAQKVDAGTDAVGLHCENGNSPFQPHLCWFFCEKAATAGSQTTVCDGIEVWNALSEEARNAFYAQPVVYSRNVEETKWKVFAQHLIGHSKPLAQITLQDLLDQMDDPENTTIAANPDGSIHYAYRVGAVHTTQFSDRLAFANSILGPSYNYEKPRITFADGSPLPEALLREIAEVTEAKTQNIEWQAGDIALIDNTRTMHGRRAILDADRVIYNALSYVS
jgi:alpha-ketoglutarate-dependent taurine dioxygenase